MSKLLNQETPTYGSLAGNGRAFEVPPFQRDYSWDIEEWEDFIYRLGNLTLLESGKNREAGRKSFDKKQLLYASSTYKLSSERVNSTEWNPVSLSARQQDMANKAATIWKINY